jgi:hypothetical protein|tara:strand:- start:1689 stop:1922 length:234 start_codon:yes stop_codon:yes gene_type:complete
MSDYVPKDGDLSLFENDKEGNENRPDLTGYAWIDGEKKRVSVWAKNSGKLRYSGRIEEPYNGAGSSASNSVSSEVPF